MSAIFSLGTRSALAAVAGGLLLASTGCTVQTAPPPAEPRVVMVEDVQAEPVTVVPERIERYPHTTYRGEIAYHVNGRWYYRSRERGWVILRQEPQELARFRTSLYVQSSVPRESPVVVVYGTPAERVTAPPVGWENSARVRYRNSDAYYIGGRWYFRSPEHGWVVLRDEPRELGDWRRSSGATLRVGGYLVEPSGQPRDVTRYPRVPYAGSFAYLIDGRWYYQSADAGWVVFREEPRELSRRRVELGSRRW